MDCAILFNWMSPFPILGVSGILFHFSFILNRNSCKQTSVDPDQTPHSVASDLGLHCLPRSQKRDARLIWEKDSNSTMLWFLNCIAYFEHFGYVYFLRVNLINL